ncbi:zinc-binding alcohol dehydrogenase family protein [Acidianus sulfidivorans JP7]|uniref:Alcohol dehydrogenase n=1 Tax=Acidianus sulfidivorans JP7 TaxID=619593 RepID=A0A2U9IM54_9CREN|nr:zinc-binding alcohol dehydrogenase family protein [Acidianus sulfidivorans]AWR97097.1 zinc-binding alcohol dehydrogenase family protein [Acidianus sulfidivorans JP7]
MLSIIFNQGIILEDVVERPINRDFVSVKTKKVLLSFIENSIYLGLLWVKPWTILGSIGIGKVQDVGIDVDPSLQGKEVLILPYSNKYGGIGTEIDGLLTKSAVVPSDSIVPLPEKYSDKVLLYPFFSIAKQIEKLSISKRVLILGAGIIGIITYILLHNSASDIAIYSEVYKNIPGVKKITETDQKWDIVVVATMHSWARYSAEKLVTEDGKIIIPDFANSWPPTCPNNALRIYPEKIDGLFSEIEEKISDKFFEENIGYSDDIISSIPTSKRGVIIDVEKSLH